MIFPHFEASRNDVDRKHTALGAMQLKHGPILMEERLIFRTWPSFQGQDNL
jgi:hypothetical protein